MEAPQPANPISPTPDAPVQDLAPIVAAAESLQRALQGAQLLGVDHPATIAGCALAAEAARTYTESRGILVLTVAERVVNFHDLPLGSAEKFAALHAMLSTHNASALVMRPGIDADALARFVTAIDACRREHTPEHTVCETVNTQAGATISLVPVDYSTLRTTAAQHRGEAHGATMLMSWEEFGQAMLAAVGINLRSGEAPAAPVDLHAMLRTAGESGDNVRKVRGMLANLATSMDRMEDAQREHVAQQLAAFAGQMSPEMRAKLTSFDPMNPEESVKTSTLLADVMPVDEVIEALRTVDSHTATPSNEAIRLCMKIARLVDNSPKHRAAVASIEEKWITKLEASEGVRGSLEEILERRNKSNFAPDDYSRLLTRLSSNIEAVRGRFADDIQTSESAMRDHSTMIAVDVIEQRTPEDSKCAGAFHAIAARPRDVLSRLAPSEILGLVGQVRLMADGATDYPTRAEAARCDAVLTGEDAIDLVIAAACECEGADIKGIDITPANAVSALRSAAERSATGSNERALGLFDRVLARSDPADVQAFIDELARRNPAVLLWALPRVLRDTRVRSTLQLDQLTRSTDARTRCVAYECMHDFGFRLTHFHISEALNDPDEAVWRTNVSWVHGARSGEVLKMFGAALRAEHNELHAPVYFALAEAMVGSGEAGEAEAVAVFTSLTNRISPRHARLAERLAIVLEQRGKSNAARKAVARWKRSLSRFFGTFVGQNNSSHPGRNAA